MTPIFDLDKLRKLLHDFYTLAKIRITVFDEELHELVAYPEEIPAFCQLIRSSSKGFDACAGCDRAAAAKAAQTRDTYIYTCHAGLTEAVTPLFIGEVLIGYLFFGHIFSYTSSDVGRFMIQDRCRELPVDVNALLQSCEKLPQFSREYIESATQIFHAVASYLILEQMAVLHEDRLTVQLKAYITAHYTDTEKVTASVLCRELGIGKTQLYQLSNQVYHRGISQQIRKMRMDLAKTMLAEDPRVSISEVASACGFSDYNYFISVFSREVGCSPGSYRRSLYGSSSGESGADT